MKSITPLFQKRTDLTESCVFGGKIDYSLAGLRGNVVALWGIGLTSLDQGKENS
jgi:hypothetical protein